MQGLPVSVRAGVVGPGLGIGGIDVYECTVIIDGGRHLDVLLRRFRQQDGTLGSEPRRVFPVIGIRVRLIDQAAAGEHRRFGAGLVTAAFLIDLFHLPLEEPGQQVFLRRLIHVRRLHSGGEDQVFSGEGFVRRIDGQVRFQARQDGDELLARSVHGVSRVRIDQHGAEGFHVRDFFHLPGSCFIIREFHRRKGWRVPVPFTVRILCFRRVFRIIALACLCRCRSIRHLDGLHQGQCLGTSQQLDALVLKRGLISHGHIGEFLQLLQVRVGIVPEDRRRALEIELVRLRGKPGPAVGLCLHDMGIETQPFHGITAELTDLLIQIVFIAVAKGAVQQEDHGPHFLPIDILVQGLEEGVQICARRDAHHQLILCLIVAGPDTAADRRIRVLFAGLSVGLNGGRQRVQIIAGILQRRLPAAGQRRQGNQQQDHSDQIFFHSLPPAQTACAAKQQGSQNHSRFGFFSGVLKNSLRSR